MSPPIVLIHGGFVTPVCWDPFVSYFEARGYRCIALAAPGKDRPVDEIREDPSPLAGFGIREIVDHYERIVRSLDQPPILVGHSFGGLFVQLLLDRGLGAAGIAIASAPPKGVFALEPAAVRSLGRVLLTSMGRRRIVHWTFDEFRFGMAHTMPLDQARAEYNRNIVPETGRIFMQTALSTLDPASPAQVDFGKVDRSPLLFMAGEADRSMLASIVRRTWRAYHQASPARSDLRSFPGRPHWLIASEGWQEVAQACIDWIASLRRVDASLRRVDASLRRVDASLRLHAVGMSPGEKEGRMPVGAHAAATSRFKD